MIISCDSLKKYMEMGYHYSQSPETDCDQELVPNPDIPSSPWHILNYIVVNNSLKVTSILTIGIQGNVQPLASAQKLIKKMTYTWGSYTRSWSAPNRTPRNESLPKLKFFRVRVRVLDHQVILDT